jgi:hypothetical protein
MMARITAHEYEGVGIGSHSCKATHMSNRVAGTIKQIEGTIAEEIEGFKTPYF